METGGRLGQAMVRFINQTAPAPGDADLIRAYLAQWIGSPVWDKNPYAGFEGRQTLERLRASVGQLKGRTDFDWFIEELVELGMDPL
jgi:hypothetical protein